MNLSGTPGFYPMCLRRDGTVWPIIPTSFYVGKKLIEMNVPLFGKIF